MGALDGVRVLDLSRVLAGPFCGQLLADNGADVIKVEAPGGDMNRAFPQVLGPGESTNFTSVNRGKRDLTLNLKDPRARDLVHRLVTRMDVVIQSFLPETAARLGVDYETLCALNPDLVYASVSGYGRRGALANKPGYDLMVAAYSGIMSMTGEPDRPPVRPGVSAVDLATGMLAYGGIVSALHARATGRARGQRVDVSLLESAVTLLGFHAVTFLATGQVDTREGAGYSTLAPYGAYPCADADILLGAPTEAGWRKLCEVLAAPDLLADPRFATNADRCAHGAALRERIETVLATAPAQAWLERLEGAGLPAAPIRTVDQVMTDPQVLANEMVVAAARPDGTEMRLIGLPFKLSETPGRPGAAPPAPGQHNEAILGELGLEPSAIRTLAEQGVI